MSDSTVRHFDQAHQVALDVLRDLADRSKVVRALLFPDIFALIRVALWPPANQSPEQLAELEKMFADRTGPFWGGLWQVTDANSDTEREFLESLWAEGMPDAERPSIVRINECHRSLSAWLRPSRRPPWPNPRLAEGGPPIVSFYAFKDGVGRSTAMAIFAAQRAQAGERVAMVDLDLASSGVDTLLGGVETAQAGVADYWLEQPWLGEALNLRDYYIPISQPSLVGAGEIFVFPAGRLNALYLPKLARLEFAPPNTGKHPLETLLLHIRDALAPDWILIDAQAGFSETAGFVLGGLAHLTVLFGGASDAHWRGLRLAVQRLGADRIRCGQPQDECMLVFGMAPANPEVAYLAETQFLRQAEAAFEADYYLPDSQDESDNFWCLRDMESRDAPHRPAVLYYSQYLAYCRRPEDLVAYGLSAGDYRQLGERIADRFSGMAHQSSRLTDAQRQRSPAELRGMGYA